MKQLAVAVVIGLCVVACASAAPPPLTASRVSAPSRIELGVGASLTFTLARGYTGVPRLRTTVVATDGGAHTTTGARSLGAGRYAAIVRPRRLGRWALRVRAGGAELRLGSLRVVRPRLLEPYKAIVEGDGTVVVADGGLGGGRLISIEPRSGRRVVVAGDGGTTFAAAGKDATASSLGRVYSVARSPAGELHALVDNRIVKISRGRIRVVAGTGRSVSRGDGGPAAKASLAEATDIEFDSDGDLLVAELGSNRVRRIEAGSGRIATVTDEVVRPFKLGFAHDGSLLVTQVQAGNVYRVDARGRVSVFLADVPVVSAVVRITPVGYLLSQHPPEHGGSGDILRLDADGRRMRLASAAIHEPTSLARGEDGTVYVTAFDPAVPLGRVDLTTGAITPIR